jgi:hypothetical protein
MAVNETNQLKKIIDCNLTPADRGDERIRAASGNFRTPTIAGTWAAWPPSITLSSR